MDLNASLGKEAEKAMLFNWFKNIKTFKLFGFGLQKPDRKRPK